MLHGYKYLDTLIRALEELEIPISFVDNSKKLQITVKGEHVPFYLKEHYKQIEHQLTPEELKKKQKGQYFYAPAYDHIPTGELSLIIDSYLAKQKNWNDGKRQKVEDCLGEFIIGLIHTAEVNRIRTEERRREHEQWLKDEQRRLELEQLRESETNKLEQLIKDANDWK